MDGRFAKEVVSKECNALSWLATLLVSSLSYVGMKGECLRVWRIRPSEQSFKFVRSRAGWRNNEVQPIPLTCSVLFLFIILLVIMVVIRRL